MTAPRKGMSPRAKSFTVAGVVASAVAIAATGLFFGVGALSAQSAADRVYAQHHPVGETKEKRAAAELKMKQEAVAEEKKREQANEQSGQGGPEAVYTPPPQPQVAANRTMPAGAADPASPARSTTALYADSFAKDLLMARAMVSGSAAQPVAATLVPDSCMESWVREHLHDYDGRSAFGVTTLCGRPVALIAGAGGIDEKILLFGSAQKGGPQDVRQLLLASTGTDVSFASASTEDGRTVVMIAAVAP